MNRDRWAVGLGALMLVLWGLLLCAGEGRAATLRARSSDGVWPDTTFLVNGQDVAGAVSSSPQPDGTVLLTQPADVAQGDAIDVRVCNALGCVQGVLEDGSPGPLIVAPPPPPAPLTAPIIKTAIRVAPETIEARLKDYDTHTLGSYPYVIFERFPEREGEWIEVDSWLAPSQVGLPANERLWLLDAADPGCTGVRARVLREGGQESPWSAPVTVGTCGQLPPPEPAGCEWDLSGNGAVDLVDLGHWVLGFADGTYTGRDWLAISAAFGTVCP